MLQKPTAQTHKDYILCSHKGSKMTVYVAKESLRNGSGARTITRCLGVTKPTVPPTGCTCLKRGQCHVFLNSISHACQRILYRQSTDGTLELILQRGRRRDQRREDILNTSLTESAPNQRIPEADLCATALIQPWDKTETKQKKSLSAKPLQGNRLKKTVKGEQT